MVEFTNEQIEYARYDLENNMVLTKWKMISDLSRKMKSENPNVSNEEIMKKVEEMSKKNNWNK